MRMNELPAASICLSVVDCQATSHGHTGTFISLFIRQSIVVDVVWDEHRSWKVSSPSDRQDSCDTTCISLFHRSNE